VDPIVPTVELPPTTPFTCQVTAVFAAFDTVAVNCRLPPPAWTAATAGITEMVTGCVAVVSVTAAEPVCVESAEDTAETVTVAGDGNAAGDT
jgi:hypothetical protein